MEGVHWRLFASFRLQALGRRPMGVYDMTDEERLMPRPERQIEEAMDGRQSGSGRNNAIRDEASEHNGVQRDKKGEQKRENRRTFGSAATG
jgi:hypothetical protein